jgi:hypothetical protein
MYAEGDGSPPRPNPSGEVMKQQGQGNNTVKPFKLGVNLLAYQKPGLKSMQNKAIDLSRLGDWRGKFGKRKGALEML